MNDDGLNFSEFLEFAEAYKVQRTKEQRTLGFDDDLDEDRLEEFFNICNEIQDNETVAMTDLEVAFIFCNEQYKERCQ